MRALPASCFKIQARETRPYSTASNPHPTTNHKLVTIANLLFIMNKRRFSSQLTGAIYTTEHELKLYVYLTIEVQKTTT
jgi:hypothetical protein